MLIDDGYFLEPVEPRAYGTHRKLLLQCLALTEAGPVLELGMGSSSTPQLRRYCREHRRPLFSIEDDPAYFAAVGYYGSVMCSATLVSSYDAADVGKIFRMACRWSVVLVDHGHDGWRRVKELLRLYDKTDVFVLHDTEPSSPNNAVYELIYPMFKYSMTDDSELPHTRALSNTHDVSRLVRLP